MRLPAFVVGLLPALLVVSAALWPAHTVAEELSVQIEIDTNVQKGRISPFIFGAGIDNKTNPLRAPKHPDKVLRHIAESGLRIARYPGGFVFNRNDHRGSWSNFYWQDHIGKNPDRLPTEVYDLDTFLQLCERFEIEPLMQINFVGEPQESVQGYIEYLIGDGDIDNDGIDWAAKRKANGREKPYSINYWQLGNEVHSYPQGFQENAAGAKEYAQALGRLVPVIRRMSPGAKIVVPFINIQRPRSEAKPKPDTPDINFTTSHEFAIAFLEHLDVRVDYFDWHFYAANGWNGKYDYLDTDDEWKHLYCWGTKFRECHEVISQLIRDKCRQQPPPKLIVGEWSGDWTGGIFRQHSNSFRGSLMRTMATGIFMADQLIYMTKRSVPSENIHAAFWHSFCNDAQAMFSIQTTREQGLAYKGKSTDEGYGYPMPIYWVFKLLSEQRGDVLVESHLHGDNLIEAPQPGLYRDPDYTFERISHFASLSRNAAGHTLYLALLNKDANRPVTIQLDVSGVTATEAEIHDVRAARYLTENTIAQPDAVHLTGPRKEQIVDDAGRMSYRLMPNTLAVLRIPVDKDSRTDQSNRSTDRQTAAGSASGIPPLDPSGVWVETPWATPVIDRGMVGTWDHMAVDNPYVHAEGNRFFCFYEAQDKPIANGGREAFGLAVSQDGNTWRKLSGNPILTTGAVDAWDHVVAKLPTGVIKRNSLYHLFYSGRDSRTKQIGLATARQLTGPWTKSPDNPVLRSRVGKWDQVLSTHPAPVFEVAGRYHLLFRGMERRYKHQGLGLAVSSDLIDWKRSAETPLIPVSEEIASLAVARVNDGFVAISQPMNLQNRRYWFSDDLKQWRKGPPVSFRASIQAETLSNPFLSDGRWTVLYEQKDRIYRAVLQPANRKPLNTE